MNFDHPEINSQREKLLKAFLSAGMAGLTTAQCAELSPKWTNRISEIREDYFIEMARLPGKRTVRYTLTGKKSYQDKMKEIEDDREAAERMIENAIPLTSPRELQGRLVEVRVGPNGKLVLLAKGKGAYTV